MKTKQILIALGIIVFLGASCVRSSSKCKKDYKKVRKNNNARSK